MDSFPERRVFQRQAAAAAAAAAAAVVAAAAAAEKAAAEKAAAEKVAAEKVAAEKVAAEMKAAAEKAPAGLLQEVPASPEKRKVGFVAQASPSKRASVAEWLFGKSWAAAATGTAAAASQPVIPVAVAVEVVEPLAVVAAVPKRKVGFDAEVPPAKAAAGATPGLPFYSTAAGLAAVRAAVKAEKAARGAQPE